MKKLQSVKEVLDAVVKAKQGVLAALLANQQLCVEALRQRGWVHHQIDDGTILFSKDKVQMACKNGHVSVLIL